MRTEECDACIFISKVSELVKVSENDRDGFFRCVRVRVNPNPNPYQAYPNPNPSLIVYFQRDPSKFARKAQKVYMFADEASKP